MPKGEHQPNPKLLPDVFEISWIKPYFDFMVVKDFNSLQSYFRSRHIFDDYGLERIGVFGSLARGEAFNDIDLMIDSEVSFSALLKLQAQMESDLNIHVDIVIKELAEPIILYRAMKDMQYATRH